jgi:hypothetical protein
MRNPANGAVMPVMSHEAGRVSTVAISARPGNKCRVVRNRTAKRKHKMENISQQK